MRKLSWYWLALSIGVLGAQAQARGNMEPGLEQLQALSDAFAEVVAKVKPGVVAIATESTVAPSAGDSFRGTPFEHFFGRPPGRRHPTPQPRQGQGSGVIVRYGDDDYVLTNHHVVRGADEIRVDLTDERHFRAEVVGTDSLSDLAVLRLDAADLPAVPLGDSGDLQVGEWVLALGNPFGFEHTVTSGIVSALGRGRFNHEYGSFIQTDADINPGNSGGPLVNMHGEIVGINTAIVGAGSRMNGGAGSLGIGFAIPANLVKDVLKQLIEHGEVRRGLLGAYIDDLEPLEAEALGMDNTQGVLVEKIVEDGPAAKAGLKRGDVVLAMDGTATPGATELRSRIGATDPGTTVELRVLRKGDEKTIEVELGQLNADSFPSRQAVARTQGKLGLTVQELTPEAAAHLGYEGESGALVAAVAPGSEAARRGIRRGDLIQEINSRPVEDPGGFDEALARVEPGQAVLLLVRRGPGTSFVGLRMPEK